jgi:3-hydroxyisobutyrate dehydrogenase-like beta-hydroxyacid dehydrogenase
MGAALARAFLRGERATCVWNRTASKAEPLAEAGARAAESLAAAIDAGDLIVLCVLDYAATDALLADERAVAALNGKTVVQLTTGTAVEASELGARIEAAGARYLDGAIMAYSDQIGTAEASILYSGDHAAFAQYEPVLRDLAGMTMFVGTDVGVAAATECALLSFYYGSMLAYTHGAAICASSGIPLPVYFGMVTAFMPALGKSIAHTGGQIASGEYAGDQSAMRIHHKSMQVIAKLAREHGVDSGFPEFVAGYYGRAVEAGHAEHEISALFETLKKASE